MAGVPAIAADEFARNPFGFLKPAGAISGSKSRRSLRAHPERGSRKGSTEVWRSLAAALRVPVDLIMP
jgi:hypothetical protein